MYRSHVRRNLQRETQRLLHDVTPIFDRDYNQRRREIVQFKRSHAACFEEDSMIMPVHRGHRDKKAGNQKHSDPRALDKLGYQNDDHRHPCRNCPETIYDDAACSSLAPDSPPVTNHPGL